MWVVLFVSNKQFVATILEIVSIEIKNVLENPPAPSRFTIVSGVLFKRAVSKV